MASQIRVLRHQNRASADQLRQLLRPLVKAYVLGYASSTAPRLLTLLVTLVTKKSKDGERDFQRAFLGIYRILRGGLEWQRFPTFCAALIGGTGLLQIPLGKLFASIAANTSPKSRDRLSTWCASFIAGWFSMKLLQSKEGESFTDRVPSPNGISIKSRVWAGRTLDLTLFAVVRAVDVIVGEVWAQRKAYKLSVNRWHKSDDMIAYLTDPAMFSASSALVMWAWIYFPEKLPRAYNKWLENAASIDWRLIEALRRFRWGELVYGKDTGQSQLITGMCLDYSLPVVWGDPTKTIPFPCDIVHMGTTSSCESHAVRRFAKGFVMAFAMYGSINSALFLLNPSLKSAKRAGLSSIRSSAFLGTFIAIFYYGVCLARCRVGPKLLGTDAKTAQRIDGGICIGTGCAVSGWSLLLENEGRHKDIALFVAPRALATLLPRRYEMKHQWKETLAFATSAAVILTCARENPKRVRGVLGRVLATVSCRR